MNDIERMINRLKKLKANHVAVAAKTLQENRSVILSLQRDQLLSGIDRDGKALHPTYQADPFFNKTLPTNTRKRKRFATKSNLETYVKYKRSVSAKHKALIRYKLFSQKGEDTPNLIFAPSLQASKFQKGLRVRVNKNELHIHSNWNKAKSVEGKYPTALGLHKDSVTYLYNKFIIPDLVEYFNNKTK